MADILDVIRTQPGVRERRSALTCCKSASRSNWKQLECKICIIGKQSASSGCELALQVKCCVPWRASNQFRI